MSKIKCAIVGLGRIGSTLEKDKLREKPCTHAGVISFNKGCILAGGCDTDKKKCDAFSKDWNCKAVFTDIEKMLEKLKPDILHIATPQETHYSIIKRAVPYIPKLIICEKPLAHNLEDAKKILDIYKKNKVIIIVNHERRYSKDYIKVKNHIEAETYGELLSVSAKVYMGQNSPAKNILLHDGTHLIDIVQFITGKKLIIEQHQKNKDFIFMFCKADKIPVVIEAGSKRDHILFELDISFTKGRIRIGNGLYEEYKSVKSPYYEKMRSAVLTNAKRPKKTGYFSNMMIDAINCVRDNSKEPVSSAEDAFYVIKMIDQVCRQSYS